MARDDYEAQRRDITRLMVLAYIEGYCDSPTSPDHLRVAVSAWEMSASRAHLHRVGAFSAEGERLGLVDAFVTPQLCTLEQLDQLLATPSA